MLKHDGKCYTALVEICLLYLLILVNQVIFLSCLDVFYWPQLDHFIKIRSSDICLQVTREIFLKNVHSVSKKW